MIKNGFGDESMYVTQVVCAQGGRYATEEEDRYNHTDAVLWGIRIQVKSEWGALFMKDNIAEYIRNCRKDNVQLFIILDHMQKGNRMNDVLPLVAEEDREWLMKRVMSRAASESLFCRINKMLKAYKVEISKAIKPLDQDHFNPMNWAGQSGYVLHTVGFKLWITAAFPIYEKIQQ